MADGRPYSALVDAAHTNNNLPPIVGLDTQRVLSLRECVSRMGVRGLREQAEAALAQFESTADVAPLSSVDEAAAIRLYWCGGEPQLSSLLNDVLGSAERRGVEPYLPYLRLLLEALHKLPPMGCERRLWRGVAKDVGGLFGVGSVVRWWAVSRCTDDMDTTGRCAKQQSGGRTCTLFCINSRSAVHVAQSRWREAEWVLFPGTTLSVRGVQRVDDFTIVDMEEIAPHPWHTLRLTGDAAAPRC